MLQQLKKRTSLKKGYKIYFEKNLFNIIILTLKHLSALFYCHLIYKKIKSDNQ